MVHICIARRWFTASLPLSIIYNDMAKITALNLLYVAFLAKLRQIALDLP